MTHKTNICIAGLTMTACAVQIGFLKYIDYGTTHPIGTGIVRETQYPQLLRHVDKSLVGQMVARMALTVH